MWESNWTLAFSQLTAAEHAQLGVRSAAELAQLASTSADAHWPTPAMLPTSTCLGWSGMYSACCGAATYRYGWRQKAGVPSLRGFGALLLAHGIRTFAFMGDSTGQQLYGALLFMLERAGAKCEKVPSAYNLFPRLAERSGLELGWGSFSMTTCDGVNYLYIGAFASLAIGPLDKSRRAERAASLPGKTHYPKTWAWGDESMPSGNPLAVLARGYPEEGEPSIDAISFNSGDHFNHADDFRPILQPAMRLLAEVCACASTGQSR